MKKIVVLFILAFSLMAGYVDELKKYLLSKEFRIDGTFFLMRKDQGGKWIYAALDDKGEVRGYYELLGYTPSPVNPFGWKPLTHSFSIADLQMIGYFIYVGFGPDLDDPHRKPYSWVFVDARRGAVYKLMGHKKGYFEYLQENGKTRPLKGIFFHKEANKALFYSCMDSFEDSNFSIRKFSKQSGSIAYECKVGALNPYRLLAPIMPKKIEVQDHIRGNIALERVEVRMTKEPLEGLVHIQGIVGEKRLNCLRRYKPLSSQTIRTHWQLRFLANWSGDSKKLEEQGDCTGVDELFEKPLFIGLKRNLFIQGDQNATHTILFWKDIYGF